MPPKKSAGESAVVAILKEAGVHNASQISDSTLRKIYRLEDDVLQARATGSTNGALDAFLTRPPIHTFKACDNAWTTVEKQREALAREAARTAKTKQNKKLRHAPAEDENGRPVLDSSCNYMNCRDNPRCLNWLGQSLWEDDKAYERFTKQWGLSDNPMLETKDPTIPVGLKNLGATCYVNSYLQVWYQNVPFRKAVFACALDPSKEPAQQPLYHLQVTFAALQEAELKAFSPIDLVKSLDINTTDQQDAQEFAKLLMTLLENEFSKQSNPELKTLIARQFEGKIKYGTRCKACLHQSENTSSFKELEVPLKNGKTLQDQLLKSLETEVLTGDNKYRCDRCNRLRDAERYTEIVQLPPVLHFSLMRFGYDFKVHERKKSSASIEFPKSIDMSQFVTGARGSQWYDLRGILIHKGTSAHHGHYVAQIYDANFKEWFIFDDETVTPLQLVKTPAERPLKRSRTATPPSPVKNQPNHKKTKPQNGNSDSTIDLTSSGSESDAPMTRSGPYRLSNLETQKPCSSSGTKKRRIQEDDSDMEENRVATDDLVKSKDAYMLVYVRRDSLVDVEIDLPAIPVIAQQKLFEIDREYTARMNKFEADLKECERKFCTYRDIKRSVFRVWNETSDTETCPLMDKDALQAWLTAEITPAKKETNGKANGKTNGPSAANSKKASADDSESDCVEVTSKRVVNHTPKQSTPKRATSQGKGKQKVNDDSMETDEELPDLSKPTPGRRSSFKEARVVSPAPAVPANGNNENGYSEKRLGEQPDITFKTSTTRKTLRHVRQIQSERLLCTHGNVDPVMASQMKRVSLAGIAALVAADIEISLELITPDNLCRSCIWEPIQSRSYIVEHKKHVADFEALSTGQSNPSWVSKNWLEDWKGDKPHMHQEGSNGDPPPDDPDYLFDVKCEHDGLQPDEGRRVMITGRQTKFLQDLFPTWTPHTPDLPICEVCKDEYDQEVQYLHEQKKLATADKTNKRLRRLCASTRLELVPTRKDEEMRLIPRDWLSRWREWLKKPTEVDRPRAIDLRPYLCEHTGLTSDLSYNDDSKAFEIITEDEWQALIQTYKSKSGLQVSIRNSSKGRFATTPSVCEPCRNKRRLAFEELEIVLKFLNEDDMDTETGLPKTTFAVDDYDDRERSLSPMHTSVQGTRRSTRARRQPGQAPSTSKKNRNRPPKMIVVQKLETLKDIRILIQDFTGVPTIYQRFFCKNREIEDTAETIETIGITQGESLQVLLLDIPDEKDVDIASFDDNIPTFSKSRVTSKDKPKSNGRPEGFGGTALSGIDSRNDEARAAREREEAEVLAAIPGRCGICTFLNDPKAKTCEMCNNDV